MENRLLKQRYLLLAATVLLAAQLPSLAGSVEGRAVAGLFSFGASSQTTQANPVPAKPVEGERQVPRGDAEIKLSFAPLVKKSAPAVVNVYAARTIATRRSPFADDPFFEQFFRQRSSGRPRIQASLGSGVIVDSSGLIVTNNHVIDGADEVKVALSDGREFPSTVVLKDERADLAVLKIKGDEDFPVMALANSDDLEIGDLVLAIGNPFGIGQTVTNGIVSALARTHIGVNDSGYFIQTDAAINPGNSGGALVDMRGDLVGVNTAIFSKSGGSNGIGFAIPSNMVHVFIDAAKNGGRLERPYLGASFAPVTSDVAEAVGLHRPSGVLVEDVVDKGPAGSAGLKPGDVVLAIDGFRIEDPDALGYRLATAGIGKTIALDVLSAGKNESLTIPLAAAPEMPPRDTRKLTGETPFGGSSVANLSPRLADELGMPQGLKGVIVTDVEPGSFADRFGLQPKDIVTALNGEDVETSQDLEAMVLDASRGWSYEIERDGKRLRRSVR